MMATASCLVIRQIPPTSGPGQGHASARRRQHGRPTTGRKRGRWIGSERHGHRLDPSGTQGRRRREEAWKIAATYHACSRGCRRSGRRAGAVASVGVVIRGNTDGLSFADGSFRAARTLGCFEALMRGSGRPSGRLTSDSKQQNLLLLSEMKTDLGL